MKPVINSKTENFSQKNNSYNILILEKLSNIPNELFSDSGCYKVSNICRKEKEEMKVIQRKKTRHFTFQGSCSNIQKVVLNVSKSKNNNITQNTQNTPNNLDDEFLTGSEVKEFLVESKIESKRTFKRDSDITSVLSDENLNLNIDSKLKNNNCNIFKDDLVEGSCFESIKDGYISKDIDEESSSFYRSIYCPIGKKIELKNQIPSLNINCNINKISQIQKTETDDMMNSDVSSMYTYRNTNASLNGYPNTQNLNSNSNGVSSTNPNLYIDATQSEMQHSPEGKFSRSNTIFIEEAYHVSYKGFDNDKGCEILWNEINISSVKEDKANALFEEIEQLKEISQNENFNTILSTWKNGKESIVIITETYGNDTLRAVLKKQIGKQKLKVIKGWIVSLLKCLQTLHKLNKIFSDLSCNRILINTSSGTIFIQDLFIASFKFYQTINKKPYEIFDVNFMAPELLKKNELNEKSDIYSLGMTILEMITLEIPFSEIKNKEELFNSISEGKLPNALNKLKEESLREFLMKLIAFNPEERLSADKLLEDSFLKITPEDNRYIKLKAYSKILKPQNNSKKINTSNKRKINIYNIKTKKLFKEPLYEDEKELIKKYNEYKRLKTYFIKKSHSIKENKKKDKASYKNSSKYIKQVKNNSVENKETEVNKETNKKNEIKQINDTSINQSNTNKNISNNEKDQEKEVKEQKQEKKHLIMLQNG